MALVNRISTLFKADFHAVLDQLEEPEQVLKQAIREMADELVATEQRIAAFAHEEQALASRMAELEAALTDVNLQLDLCFRSGRDELAKKMIRRKLEADRLLKRLAANRRANDERLAEERRLFDYNNMTLQGLRQKAELFTPRAPGQSGQRGAADDIDWMARQMAVSEEEVEIAWLREKDARSTS